MESENVKRKMAFSIAGRAITIGLWINVILMVVKLLSGHFGHSEAVFADGLESATDLLAMVAGMAALKIGSKPFDDEHPYGHGKAESIAAFFISLVILTTGGSILYGAVITILEKDYGTPGIIAVIATVITIASKEALFRYTRGIAKKTQSPTLDAIATDHRKDALTSIATLIGVGGAYWGIALLDPIAAGLTALFIFHIGWQTLRSASNDLMDGQPPEGIIIAITEAAACVPGVDCVNEVRIRRSGQNLIVDLKLDMDSQMTVQESHGIGNQVRKLIFDRFPRVGDIMIHIHPSLEDHGEISRL
ncbi:MAG: cation diffusion facilitator family transporter [Syntrophales bacterium]